MNAYRLIPARRQRLAANHSTYESTVLYGALMVALGYGLYWLASHYRVNLPEFLFFACCVTLLAIVFGGAWLVARTGGAE